MVVCVVMTALGWTVMAEWWWLVLMMLVVLLLMLVTVDLHVLGSRH